MHYASSSLFMAWDIHGMGRGIGRDISIGIHRQRNRHEHRQRNRSQGHKPLAKGHR